MLMGVNLTGWVRLPRPQLPVVKLPATSPLHPWLSHLGNGLKGPYGVGLTFGLVSSPCTSPVMFSVLAAGAATGSQVLSTLAMVSYALGYTAIIFLASLFTGLAKQTRQLLRHAETISRFAGGLLLLVGGFYLVDGGRWVIATLLLPSL